MKYENMPCPVCGSHMHESDDIVVCPDCGTPCHRECWMELGHCANESKHDTGFRFSYEKRESIFEGSTDKPEETPDDMITCHICGSENPVTSTNCNHCGALLIHSENGEITCPICKEKVQEGMVICPNCGASLLPKSEVPFRAYNPFNGDDPDEKIGENTAGEIGAYVRTNQRKYIKKFHNIEDGGKINFNWAAFFFGPFWFLFRKMFLYGTVLILALSCVSLITVPSSEEAIKIFNKYSPQITEYNKIAEGTSETSESASSETQAVTTGKAKISYDIEVTTAAEGSTAAAETPETKAEETTTAESATAESTTAAPEETSADESAAASDEESTTAAETTSALTADEATQKSIELQTKMYSEMLQVMKKPMLITLLIYLIVDILCGFYADSLYYRKVKKDLEAVKNDIPDLNVREMLISRRGGVSVLNVICGWFILSICSDLVTTIADYIANLF